MYKYTYIEMYRFVYLINHLASNSNLQSIKTNILTEHIPGTHTHFLLFLTGDVCYYICIGIFAELSWKSDRN